MSPTLSEIETLARQVGDILRAGFGRKHTIDHKGLIDVVTEVDRRSEAFILREIRRRYPQHRIIAEESGGVSGADGQCWYVDPLDGTVNYAHGVPIFAVSLAYAEDGEIRFGVVYDPMQEECFSAERGQGARLNGQSLQVSTTADLNHSLLVTGFPYDIRTNPDNNLNHYAHFALCSQGVRRLGSAALDLCYVAAGRFDGYWELRLKAWDVAAGGLIAQEAGAVVTDLQGSPQWFRPPYSLLVANPHIYPLMRAHLDGNLSTV